MQEKTPGPPADPPEYFETPNPAQPRRLSRRALVGGGVIAVALLAGLGWWVWELTHPDTPATAGAGGPGGPGGPGGGGGGGGRMGGGGPGGGGLGGGRTATTVGIAVAQAADIPVNLEALGTVVPRATARVRPQVSGPLVKIHFTEGQNVKRGQLLAEIDPRPFEMQLQQAIGQRMRDEAQLAVAKTTLTRYRTLLQQDSIARQEVDQQAAQVGQLEATVVSSKAQEGTARLNLSYTRISAPISGRIGLRAVDVGNTVSPSDANGIGTITELTPIDVEFSIPQDHASWLQHNSGAFMEVKAYDRTKTELLDTGVFASLDNQIDTTTGTVKAKARFNNARMQMFPSQFVNVQLQVRTIKDAVVVPVTAVRQSGTGEFVFVLQQDRTVQMRPVVRGQLMGDRVQLVSGLRIGERVVTEGADRLRDGSRVILPGDTPGQGWGGGGGRRRQGGASGATPGASSPFQGASAAQGPGGGGWGRGGDAGPGGSGGGPGMGVGPRAGSPFAGASAMQRQAEAGAPSARPGGQPEAGAMPARPNAQAGSAPARQRAESAAPPPAQAAAAGGSKGPTPEQRQRMLDAVKDNPEQLERRKRFLAALDRGDPEAIERWQMMQQRRREGGGGSQ
ncbi:efflux RND transporter periplasmic adaptor subunit [Ramlibacter albus]|uniref:Efflux RND transporter periplasmic adaptor subunit n=1 Tax=Ramlibacter albus TaxID=2079448 RepID=A0A923S590_9BURK|nr:efflux RND transporter periplasmic adaptor subunit [Ramlibacter albus]